MMSMRLVGIISLFLLAGSFSFAQEEDTPFILKNQVSVNTTSLLLTSPNLSYERTLSNHFSIGLSGTIYGKPYDDLNIETNSFEYKTNYEINPYGRWYMNGTHRKSHFLEVFVSINEGEESGRFIRETNTEGFGVYNLGVEKTNNVGVGGGYGYRFLLLDNKLLLEGQISLRTNFMENFLFFDAALVRTGIKVGYRF